MAREEAPRRREKASDIPDATTPRRPVARRKTSGDSSGTPAGLKDVSDPDASAERPSASGGGSRRRPRRRRGPREARAGKERTMLVHADPDGTQIAVLEGGEIVEHYVTRVRNRSLAGNVYLGRVQNVLPGMEASFVDIGEARNGVLYAGEVGIAGEEDDEVPRIETVLKPGQAILVQVTKDPMRSKGARLTALVSIAGRHLVLVPNARSTGVSRRLSDAERIRLRDLAQELRPAE